MRGVLRDAFDERGDFRACGAAPAGTAARARVLVDQQHAAPASAAASAAASPSDQRRSRARRRTRSASACARAADRTMRAEPGQRADTAFPAREMPAVKRLVVEAHGQERREPFEESRAIARQSAEGIHRVDAHAAREWRDVTAHVRDAIRPGTGCSRRDSRTRRCRAAGGT